MNVKQQQRGGIESLLFEGRPGDEIAQPLHDVYGQDAYCRASGVGVSMDPRGSPRQQGTSQ
jgi:hypothetical protein